jgi:APA family basic amino acid/polyamine antiporter
MSTTTTPTGTPAPLAGGSEPGFQRKLTLFDATMLIVGTMIGSGIFVVSADIARDVGSSGWLMGVWLLAGLMTMMGALAYAELAGMMPQAGGQYIFLREAYSPLWGFLYGWTCFLVIQTGSIAAVAVAFSKYLGVLVPRLGADPSDQTNLFTPIPVNLELSLPYVMSGPFFKMETFTITGGQVVAVAVIIFLTWLNCRGVQEGKTVQNVFTVTKTLALMALILVGLSLALSVDVWNANWAEPWGGIATTNQFDAVSKKSWARWFGGDNMIIAFMVAGGAMVGALFAADAWNNVTFTAGEIQNPKRNLPRSLALGAGLVIFLYLLANVAYLAVLPINGSSHLANNIRGYDHAIGSVNARLEFAREADKQDLVKHLEQELKEKQDARAELLKNASARDRGIAFADDDRVATAVVQTVSPNIGPYLMALAIMISTFGCVNGMTLMGARLYWAMARDGLFFQAVGGLNKRGVPAAGLILQGIWSILLVFSGTYSQLLDFVIFAVLIFYVLTVAGLFILRWKMPNAERPTRAFGYPIVPAIYVLLCLVICANLLIVKPAYTWPGLIIVVSGIPVYFLWRIFGKKPEPPTPQTPTEPVNQTA